MAAEILGDPDTIFSPQLEYAMQDTVRAVMALFGYETGKLTDG
jgi:hypothetical protein